MGKEKSDDSHEVLKEMDKHDEAQPGEILKDTPANKDTGKDKEPVAIPK